AAAWRAPVAGTGGPGSKRPWCRANAGDARRVCRRTRFSICRGLGGGSVVLVEVLGKFVAYDFVE
ncbi:MAG: hypothetical protein ACE5GO_03425, partial [Anaerolineales bacterium]